MKSVDSSTSWTCIINDRNIEDIEKERSYLSKREGL